MARLFHLVIPVLAVLSFNRNNPQAIYYYYQRTTCEYYCTDPNMFCAEEAYYPWMFYCTDGSTPECDIRRYRDYYIKVEKVSWDYLPSGVNKVNSDTAYINDTLINRSDRVGSVYSKYIYKRYTDGFFDTEVPSPPAQGYLGPTIRGEVGDVIRVHLYNRATQSISIHPHGLLYDKFNEGAYYVDNTNGSAKYDDRIPYNAVKTVYWRMTEEFAPKDDDPNCLPFAYHSHNNPIKEINAGLAGLLVVCKPGTLSDTSVRLDVDREHILYVDSIDEGQSLLINENLQRCQNPSQCQSLYNAKDSDFMESLKKDSVNGYMYANGPPFDVCVGERVAWYIFSLEAELHAVEIHGQTFKFEHRRTGVIGIWSATFATATTVSSNPGYWLISCRNSEHNRNGMNAYLSVSSCGAPAVSEQLTGVERTYYLAAEVEWWDYGPSGLNLYDGGNLTDSGTAPAELFTQDSSHIGGSYLKARFVEYTDATFTTAVTRQLEEEHLALLGPVIRAEVGDTITVVLKNNCSFPVSMYLQGVSFNKSEDGLWEKAGGSQLSGKIANNGDVVTYTYTVPWSVSPGDDDPTCLTYLYYSAINPERDVNTGLVGPLNICKLGGINPQTGIERYVDREVFLLFADMDENLSWLIQDNIVAAGVGTNDPSFGESNVMRSINGRSYGNLEGLNLCKNERVAWHVTSVGGNEGLHGVTFNGNNVLISGVNRDSHVVIPETTFTAIMVPDMVGTWSLHCHNNDHFQKGEKALYTVDACGADPGPGYNTSGVTRTYYIAAVEDTWDYSPQTIHPLTGEDYSLSSAADNFRVRKDGVLLGSIYKKALYKEYTDGSFTTEIPRREHLGVLGPTIHVAVGDIIKVVFKNMASRAYSFHPQGLRYAKAYEGQLYQDGDTSTGDEVPPGQTFTYYWEVPQSSGPTVTGPNCVGSIYHSAVDPVKDTYSGLVGTLVICKTGILDPSNVRHDSITKEFHLLMLAFDENESWYLQDNIDANAPGTDPTSDLFIESNKYDSINGYIFNNLPGLGMNTGETVAWYGMGLGVSEDIHTIHFHGQTFVHRTTRDHTGDVIEVFPGTYETVEMFCNNPGTWLLHCHVGQHTKDGMVATFKINNV